MSFSSLDALSVDALPGSVLPLSSSRVLPNSDQVSPLVSAKPRSQRRLSRTSVSANLPRSRSPSPDLVARSPSALLQLPSAPPCLVTTSSSRSRASKPHVSSSSFSSVSSFPSSSSFSSSSSSFSASSFSSSSSLLLLFLPYLFLPLCLPPRLLFKGVSRVSYCHASTSLRTRLLW